MDKQYCTDCKKITEHTPKLSAVLDGKLVCCECYKMNGFCTLIKEGSGNESFHKFSKKVGWIRWVNDKISVNKIYKHPRIGDSLVMSPFNHSFTWQTTPITEIIKRKPGFIHFKTNNSEYKLYINRAAIKEYIVENRPTIYL